MGQCAGCVVGEGDGKEIIVADRAYTDEGILTPDPHKQQNV